MRAGGDLSYTTPVADLLEKVLEITTAGRAKLRLSEGELILGAPS